MNHLLSMVLTRLVVEAEPEPANLIDDSSQAVDTLARDINEYGVAVVIMAVFFVVFLVLVFLILKNNAKMMTQIIDRQDKSDKLEGEVLSRLVDNVLGNKSRNGKVDSKEKSNIKTDQSVETQNTTESSIDEEVHKDLVGAYIDVNMAFKDASRLTQTALNCDRVAIYVFHNGNKSMHGLPFFKMSCIHEWTNRGSNTLRGKSHIDLPLHLFSDFVEDLWKNGIYRSENVAKSIEADASIEGFVAFSKTKALYMEAVKDDNGIIAGFVVVEFENEDTFEQDSARDAEVKSALDKMVAKVSPILMYHHMYNKK